jgi:hypothetical protein
LRPERLQHFAKGDRDGDGDGDGDGDEDGDGDGDWDGDGDGDGDGNSDGDRVGDGPFCRVWCLSPLQLFDENIFELLVFLNIALIAPDH